MPTKTNFIGLDKLQDNEYYSSDIENANLDKIDGQLKLCDERTSKLEDNINNKNKLSIELKAENQIASTKESYGANCDFEIKGSLLENPFKADNKTDVVVQTGDKNYNVSVNGILSTNINERNDIYVDAGDEIFIYLELTDNSVATMDGFVLSGGQASFGRYPTNNAKKFYTTYVIKDDGIAYVRPSFDNGGTACLKKVMFINKTKSNLLHLTESQMLEMTINNYFEGLQPLRNITLESRGMNLLNGEFIEKYISVDSANLVKLDNARTTKPIRIKSKMSYTFGGKNLSRQIVRFLDCDMNVIEHFIGESKNYSSWSIPESPDHTCYIQIYYNHDVESIGESRDLYLIEGINNAYEYTEHEQSKTTIEGMLSVLPNGSYDKVVRKNAKTTKIINTNLGLTNSFYNLQAEDIVNLYTDAEHVNLILIKLSCFKDIIPQTDTIDGSIKVNGFSGEVLPYSMYYNRISSIGKIATGFDELWLIVSKDQTPDLQTAKLKYSGLKVVYQLKNPITVDLLTEKESINAYKKSTHFSVSDGVIRNEEVVPVKGIDGNNIYVGINSLGIGSNYEKENRIKHLPRNTNISIMKEKNGVLSDDTLNWNISMESKPKYWFGGLRIYRTQINHDFDSKYYINYETLETNGQSNAIIFFNANISDAVSSNSQMISNLGQQLNQNTSHLQKIKKGLDWKVPTLLNGAESIADNIVKYTKDNDGWVHIVGGDNGTGSLGNIHFTLPIRYRPKGTISFITASNTSVFSTVYVNHAGNVIQASGATNSCWFSGISFYVGD